METSNDARFSGRHTFDVSKQDADVTFFWTAHFPTETAHLERQLRRTFRHISGASRRTGAI